MVKDDIDWELEDADRQAQKEREINRILQAFKLDAYAVLGLQPGVPESDIKAVYRKKSLLIHPDKTKDPRAPDAFDRLAKAQQILMDEKQRAELDEATADARMLLIRDKKLTKDSEELKTDEFLKEWRRKTMEVILDNELRKRKQVAAAMREEGREQRKQEEENDMRKRKREYEKEWEATRPERIANWREYLDKTSGKVDGKKIAKKPAKKDGPKKMRMLG